MTPRLSYRLSYDTLVVMSVSRVRLTGDQSIAFVDSGGDGDPVVFLHGGGLDHRMWQPQLAAFPDHRVIAPDARAHGQSSTPEAGYRLVDDVLALLDALGLPTVVVVGLSMGAGTAVDLAVTAPERVRGLVVSGAGTSDPDFRDPWVLDIFRTWERAIAEQDPEAWIGAFERFLHGPQRTVDQISPDLVRLNDMMVRHTLTTHVLPVVARGRNPVRPTPVEHVNPARREIDVPVLAINGALDADDHLRFARELLELVPDGREVRIPDSAHYPNLEQPALFNDALRGFLDGLDADRG